jgi:hypothetical protein
MNQCLGITKNNYQCLNSKSYGNYCGIHAKQMYEQTGGNNIQKGEICLNKATNGSVVLMEDVMVKDIFGTVSHLVKKGSCICGGSKNSHPFRHPAQFKTVHYQSRSQTYKCP